jgi:Sulfotransferase family
MDNQNFIKEVEELKKTPIVFIVGCGRSGTTLLRSLINSHPNIIAALECHFILFMYPRFGKIKHWTRENILQFIDALYSIKKFSRWLIDREQLTKELLAVTELAEYSLLCKMVYYQMRKSKEKTMLMVDKNPIYSLFIKRLVRIYPESKFIHIVREPKDCINGHLKKFHYKNTFFLAWYWRRFNTSIESGKQKSPGKFLIIKYENLVRDTEQTMRDLCDFFHLPFDNRILQNSFPEMIHLYKDNVFEKFKTNHEGLLLPVNDSNIGKWEKEMLPRDIAITGIIAGKFAEVKYGYKVEKNNQVKISKFQLLNNMAIYYCWEIITRIRFRSYKFNIHYKGKIIRSVINRQNRVFS